MSYRPITDIWLLARCKYKNGIKRYGGYLGGFPERARALLGANVNEPVLHVCGGLSKEYPYKGGFSANDKTLDLEKELNPDFLQDVMLPFQLGEYKPKACLCDPPYSEDDCEKYKVGRENYPPPNQIIKNCFDILPVGGKVGIVHYIVPKAPKNSKFIACVGIVCGFNNRIRVFSVFEKL